MTLRTNVLGFTSDNEYLQIICNYLYTPTNHSHAKPLSLPILVNYFLWNVFV